LSPIIDSNIRRCLVRRFPFCIVYHYDERKVELLILLVMHLHRESYCWIDRA
jgi:hypothetical protein